MIRLVLISTVLLLVACTGESNSPSIATPTEASSPVAATCLTSDGGNARTRLTEYAGDWERVMAQADRMPAARLGPSIERLREISTGVQNQTWPECARRAEENLIGFMESVILGLSAFQAQEPEHVYRAHYRAAGQFQDRFFGELLKLS